MCVGSDYGGDAPIEIPAERHFFAGGFGVHVHEYEGDILRNLGEFFVSAFERIVNRRQKDAPLKIQHSEFCAIFRFTEIEAAAGIDLGKIGRAQQARLVRHEIENFTFVPTMVATGDDVDAKAEQLFHNTRGNAEAGGGVFAIGDDQVDLAVFHKVGEAFLNDFAARGTDNVADEQDTHVVSRQLRLKWILKSQDIGEQISEVSKQELKMER